MMINKNRNHWAKKKEKGSFLSKTRRIIQPIFIWRFLVVSFLAVVLYSFIFADFMEINGIEITTNGSISIDEIKNEIGTQINGKYFNVIPKDNFIFLNSNKINIKLKNKFKKIKKIVIKKEFPNKIKITIEERSLILTLCSRGACYFIDENGYAYQKIDINNEKEKQSEVIRLIDESGKEIRENDNVLLPEYVEFIVSIADELKSNVGIEILNEYRTKSRISEDVIVQTKKGWDIYLNGRISMDKSMQTLRVLLNRHLMLRDLNELEYIDLRSENRVFYRMIGGVEQEEEAIKKEEEMIKDNIPSDKKDEKKDNN